ncbi:MAG: UDP-N-acetyl-D-mannosaminuronic acid dehydrogenase [Campylobacterota bacterium]|nr:UDP-N-acetyl-D-mannosaminuronic acid dehydrogenase [Campylobacterota bacterium]
MHTDKRICIIGLGYIGLPTAALLANRSYHVHGVDINQHAVDTINRGEIHIVEPELDTFVRSAVQSGKLHADTVPAEADVFILAVPTPFHHTDIPSACPSPNIDYVIAATRSIAPYVREGNIVILESTSPVGTTDKVAEVLAEMRPELFETSSHPVLDTGSSSSSLPQTSKVFVSHCPERVLPGHIMRELVQNDRIVGGITPEATKATAEFYRTFVEGEVLETDAKTAEMAKLTENSFRDVNIAFANELSMLCDQFGIDTLELIRLANRHPRVNILQPGCGVGGHCIAVDPWFIVHAGKGSARLIETARRVNDYKSEWVIEKVKNAYNELKIKNLKLNITKEPKIGIFGLAFKPDIDDLRESPALYIAKRLNDELENVVCVEPNIPVDSELKTQHSKLNITSIEDAAGTSDLIVFLVAHREFKQPKTRPSAATTPQERGPNLKLNTSLVLDFCGVIKA